MNPELRGIYTRAIGSPLLYLMDKDEVAQVVKNWLVKIVGDFLDNCPRMEDVVIEDYDGPLIDNTFPQGTRIPALDKPRTQTVRPYLLQLL